MWQTRQIVKTAAGDSLSSKARSTVNQLGNSYFHQHILV
jgi:hypothetical protein